MRRRFGLVGVTLAVLAVSACSAHRQPSAAMVSSRQHADELFAAGCYRCLEEALVIYDRLAQTSTRDAAPARVRAFDAAALLAVRDRELGLRAQDHAPAARSRVPSPPTPRETAMECLITAEPWAAFAATGVELDAALAERPGTATRTAAYQALAALPPSDLAAQYLVRTMDCLSDEHGAAEQTGHVDLGATPPLLQYRGATCGVPDIEALEHLRQANPRFEEIELLLGNAALNGGALLTAERHLATALRAFPGMLPAAMQLGRVHIMLEEYEASLPEYQQVLDVIPDQPNALLGKARALSGLERPHDAIPILDRIIAMRSWLLGDAYYWRAWNRFQMKELDAAKADAEAALQLMSNARVHYLAGSIASAREEWPRAQTEFEAAMALDDTDCDIPLALAGVLARREAWTASAQRFGAAASCLVEAQGRYETRLDEIRTAPMDDARRARAIARTEAARKKAHSQEGLARLDAGITSAHTGQSAEARAWAQQAREWPEWRDRAEALLARFP